MCRGEIAVRVFRAGTELGLRTVSRAAGFAWQQAASADLHCCKCSWQYTAQLTACSLTATRQMSPGRCGELSCCCTVCCPLLNGCSIQVGTADMTPVACYLDVEAIISLCKAQAVDAVHPGYGESRVLMCVHACLRACNKLVSDGQLLSRVGSSELQACCRLPVRECTLCEAL